MLTSIVITTHPWQRIVQASCEGPGAMWPCGNKCKYRAGEVSDTHMCMLYGSEAIEWGAHASFYESKGRQYIYGHEKQNIAADR